MGQRGYATTHLYSEKKDDCHGYLVGTLHRGLQQMFEMMNGNHIGAGSLRRRHRCGGLPRRVWRSPESAPQGRRLLSGGQKAVSEEQTLIINHPDVRRMPLTQKAIAEGALVLQASLYEDLERAHEGAEARKYNLLLELLTPMAKTYPSEAGKRSVDAGLQV